MQAQQDYSKYYEERDYNEYYRKFDLYIKQQCEKMFMCEFCGKNNKESLLQDCCDKSREEKNRKIDNDQIKRLCSRGYKIIDNREVFEEKEYMSD